MMERMVDELVSESIRVKTRFFSEQRVRIAAAAGVMVDACRSGKKVLLFGNGGSAADAQHIAAEFVGRFGPDRPPLAAIALTTDTSALTAIANDYGYNHVFSRQVAALGAPGDVAIGISTSGNSPSVVEALDTARSRRLITMGFTGETGGKMQGRADHLFCVPSRTTARIQETHIMLAHILCDLVDRALFPEAYPEK
ncbi:MAG TPA: D-sedoheptulose 7-phosphate isomerase [Terriglobia bacterium]|nr:D-sedoheptulose 7-phosphate isomerase [Terriglobia bacterium]